VIFSLECLLSGGTKLIRDYANKLGIEGARRLRVDADYVALFSLIGGVLERAPQKQLASGHGGGASRVGKGRLGDRQSHFFRQRVI
jgi:hypothetical protein